MKVLCLSLIALLTSTLVFAQTDDTAEFSSLRILNTGTDGHMQHFSISRDQRYIVIANENKNIKIFDGLTGKFIKRIRGYHSDLIEIITLPKNERLLSAGLSDNSLATIDIQTGAVIKTLTLPTRLRCIDINKDGSVAAVGDMKGQITFVNLNDMSIISQLDSGSPQVNSIAYSPDYTQVAAGTGVAIGYMIKKYPILLLDASTRQVVKSLEGSQGSTTSLKYSYDGTKLYSGHKANKRSLKVWDLKSGAGTELKGTLNYISNSGYNGLDVDKDSKVIIATTDDQSIEVYDLTSGEQISKKGRGKIRLMRKLDHFPKIIFSLNGGENFIIGGFNQNLLYIFNAEKKGITGYFHSFNDEWAVIAADGRMDGSQSAIQNLVWKDGLNEISLDNTFEKNFTPRLLSLLISEQEVKQEFDVKQAASALPELQVLSIDGKTVQAAAKNTTPFSTDKKNIKVEVQVNKNPGDLAELRLYQNSKLVRTITGSNQSRYSFDVTLTDAFGQENFFYVTGRNKANIDSEKKTFIINYLGKTNEVPRLFIMTVGINQYKNPKYNLNFAQADANEFEKTVIAGGTSLFGGVVKINLRDSKATREEILKAFASVRNQAKEQDLFIFYYAGHGVMSEGKTAQSDFHLVPHDVTQLYGRDDLLQTKGISAAEIRELSKSINAQKQVFILDACQSSGALDAIATRGAVEEKALAQLARSTGTFWITATGTEQFATEFKDLGHGVFTYSLLEGLRGKADNGDKRITIKELSSFIENRVPELSEKYKGTPQFPSGYSYGNDFPIAIIK